MRNRISATASRRIRRFWRAIGSVSPAAITATLALVIGGAAGASAATGANFILGRANHETSTASLSDTTGTPLALSAPTRKAPLAVSNKTMVRNLNAQYLGGQTSSELQVSGGDGFIASGADVPINFGFPVVASTGPLQAGTYYVTETALLDVVVGDSKGFCWVVTKSNPGVILTAGGAKQEGEFSAAATIAVQVKSGDSLEERCGTGAVLGSFAVQAGITAIRVASSSGTKPAS
jgi:hypothetical protein